MKKTYFLVVLCISILVNAHAQTCVNNWKTLYSGNTQWIGGFGVLTNSYFISGNFSSSNNGEQLLCYNKGNPQNNWMTLSSLNNNGVAGYSWNTVWTNNGQYHNINNYKDLLYKGDFLGDNRDEIIGFTGNWITIFGYNDATNTWDDLWNNGGVANGVSPYKDNLIIGDFDGDGKDNIFAIASWITLFKFNTSTLNWDWQWSNYGNTGDQIWPYRNKLLSADVDGNGVDELIGFDGWATMWYYNSYTNSWVWSWSTNGSSHFAGVALPLKNQAFYAGDIDYDGKEELLSIEHHTAPYSANWAHSIDWANGTFNNNWNNHGNHLIGQWDLRLNALNTTEANAYVLMGSKLLCVKKLYYNGNYSTAYWAVLRGCGLTNFKKEQDLDESPLVTQKGNTVAVSNMQSASFKITITNIQGQKIKELTHDPLITEYNINALTDYSPGIYFFNVEQNGVIQKAFKIANY